jgi:hypothetical protein
MLDVHIVPRLGRMPLRSLTSELISEMRAAMAADGVGEQAILKALTVLQSMLERAVEWGRLESIPRAGCASQDSAGLESYVRYRQRRSRPCVGTFSRVTPRP